MVSQETAFEIAGLCREYFDQKISVTPPQKARKFVAQVEAHVRTFSLDSR